MVYDPGTPSYILQSLQLSQGGSVEYFVTLQRLPMTILMGIVSGLYSIHPAYLNFIVAKTFCAVLAGSVFLLMRKLVRSNGIALVSSFLAPLMASVVLPTDVTPPGILVVAFPVALLALTQVTELPFTERVRIRKLLLPVIGASSYPLMVLLQALLVPTSIVARAVLFSTVVIFLIGLYLAKEEHTKILMLVHSSILISITYLHIENSILYGLLLSSYLLMRVLCVKRRNVALRLATLMTVLVYLFIALQVSGLLVFPSNFAFSSIFWGNLYDASWFNMNASQKLSWLTSTYGYAIILIMLLSLPLASIDSRYTMNPIAVLCAFSFLLLFLPEGHFWRIGATLNIPGAILVPYFLWRPLTIFRVELSTEAKEFAQRVRNLLNTFRLRFQYQNLDITTWVKPLIVFFIVAFLLIPTMVAHRTSFVSSTIKYVNRHGVFSYLTQSEMFAAMSIWKATQKQWVKYDYLTNLPINVPYDDLVLHAPKLTYVRYVPRTNDTLLISDPYTMLVMGGLTGRDTALIERGFIDASGYSKEALDRMDFIKDCIFHAKNPGEAYNNILSIKGSHTTVLVIVTDRTIAWMNSDDRFIVSANPLPADFFRSHLSIFADRNLFIPIYYMDNVVVYQVNLLDRNSSNRTYIPTLAHIIGRQPINSTGLIGWWRLDEGKGSSITDSSGNEHSGIILGAQWSFDDWWNRSYLTFNGKDECVRLDSFNVTAFTIEAWVYINSSMNQYARLVSKSDDYLHVVILQITPQGYLEIGYRSPDLSNNYLYSISKVPLRRWTHIAGTYEPEKGFKIYINGYLDNEGITRGNASGVPTQSNMNWFFGRAIGQFGFNGGLAMVRIYDRALSSDEILYNSGVTELLPSSTDLIVVCKDIFGFSVPGVYVEASVTGQLPVVSYTDYEGIASLGIVQPSRANNVTVTINAPFESMSFDVTHQPSTAVLNVTIILSPFLIALLLTVCLGVVLFFVFKRLKNKGKIRDNVHTNKTKIGKRRRRNEISEECKTKPYFINENTNSHHKTDIMNLEWILLYVGHFYNHVTS